MNRKLFLLYLVYQAVLLVKSETTIEIDENGDEYEVKKFHIKGRQLNEDRPQCVVTRRKRSLQPNSSYSVERPADSDNNKNYDYGNIDEEQESIPFSSPPIIIPTANEGDYEGGEEQHEDGGMKRKEIETLINMEDNSKNKTTQKEEMPEKELAQKEKNEVIKIDQLPGLNESENGNESASAITSAKDPIEVDTTGIVVVQSHAPAKFDSQTHTLYELIPVNQFGFGVDEGVDDDSVKDDYHIKEELSPITTTAVWSTGDDSLDDLYDDLNLTPTKPQGIVKGTRRRPSKVNKKTTVKPKRKNKYRGGITNGNQKQGNKKKNPNKTRLQRRNKKRKPNRGSNFRRRRIPQKNKNTVNGFSNNKRKKSKKSKNTFVDDKQHNFNNNNRVIAKKKKKNDEVIDQGTNTLSRTVTMTQTGDEDKDPTINCIIIRQEPTTTTRRPFWNIFGRSANGAPQASGQFGKRKRANLHFVS